ncbi:2-vinyl bacteriochlorophyllide hydratase [Polynucleobacter sp. Nonnen-W13]|jgi:3-vinyl bacteriochlorophyllide hydratase|uniref:2-vinyl bacteriochlorophyllide hydratase n=1 Tax=Polynucleobacter sp. Nonnen-W13 TaxID=1855625 RepID=UPI001C0CF609|nr:2-vinyl bacteriochlorophyllide hydratase [Polynucleobacter sp. Nonnen-W13]MBU3559344.1 2-vinyl bacteriochlorophyllide hydratase [Polynucleobacter sp. Nonnen-W13]
MKINKPLYSQEQRAKRDATVWTLVQGILAPVQFLVCLISLYLVLQYLISGSNYELATISVVVKTFFLYLIMLTGSIWEKVVFGKYLFADSFFWEDVFSMLVISLHTIYLYFLMAGGMSDRSLMYLALAAYTSYFINAGQFIYKLRMARLQFNDQVAA